MVVRDRDVPQKDYGNFVVIWNRENHRGWWYCHLAKNVVSLGQEVRAGEILGVMGNTGNSHGYHLHLGLRMADANGYAVNLDNGYRGFLDPLPLLEGR